MWENTQSAFQGCQIGLTIAITVNNGTCTFRAENRLFARMFSHHRFRIDLFLWNIAVFVLNGLSMYIIANVTTLIYVFHTNNALLGNSHENIYQSLKSNILKRTKHQGADVRVLSGEHSFALSYIRN